MKTKLSPENPFGPHPKGYLWEVLRRRSRSGGGVARHFDYGARDGSMLRILSETGVIAEGVGVDLDADVVQANEHKLPRNVVLKAVQKNPVLDFPDGAFDTVSIIGVVEHIHRQEPVLRELRRVLKSDGELIVAVPGKHFFSFLDMGNFKFVFPRIHRWFYTWRHGAAQYHERYVECRNGLIGDIEVEKRWHQHFSFGELRGLLESCGFEVTAEDGFGFFNRVLINLAYFLPGPLKRGMNALVDLDARLFHRAEIFVSARPRPVLSQPKGISRESDGRAAAQV
jgi:SAM-dependent methyltransferase